MLLVQTSGAITAVGLLLGGAAALLVGPGCGQEQVALCGGDTGSRGL